MELKMTHYTRSSILVLVFASPLLVQAQSMHVDVYVQPASDGRNVYATSVTQYTPWSPCTGMCATAVHTYSQEARVVSPSGRSILCNTNQVQKPASQSESL